MRFLSSYILFSIAAGIISAAEVSERALGGSHFTYGCGMGMVPDSTDMRFYPPLANDDGDCVFIARDPDFADSNCRGLYRLDTVTWSAVNDKIDELIAGGVNIMGVFANAGSVLQGNSDLSSLWLLSRDATDLSGRHVLNLKHVEGFQKTTSRAFSDESGKSISCDADTVFLTISSDGTRGLVFDYGYGTFRLLTLQDGAVAASENLELPDKLPDACPPLMSRNGRFVFYLGKSPANEKMAALYRYDFSSRCAEVIEDGLGATAYMTDAGIYALVGQGLMPLACTEDGSGVVYPWWNGSGKNSDLYLKVAKLNAAGKWVGQYASVSASGTLLTDESAVLCESPAISADGRFVVYAVKSKDSPVPNAKAVLRFDTLTGEVLGLSGSVYQDVRVPSLSPNGRFIAFIARESAAGTYQLHGAYCTPSLTAPDSVMVQYGKSSRLVLEDDLLDAEKDAAHFQFRFLLEDGLSGIVVRDAQGNALDADMTYGGYIRFPLTIEAGSAAHEGNLRLEVTALPAWQGLPDGHVEMSVPVMLTTGFDVLASAEKTTQEFSGAQWSADGKSFVLASNVKLTSDYTSPFGFPAIYDASLKDNLPQFEEVSCLTPTASFAGSYQEPRSSGNGAVKFWGDTQNNLWMKNGQGEAVSLRQDYNSMAQRRFAVDYSGMRFAYVDSSKSIWYSYDSGANFHLLLAEENEEKSSAKESVGENKIVFSSVCMSPDGRYLAAIGTKASVKELVIAEFQEESQGFSLVAEIPVALETLGPFVLNSRELFVGKGASWYRINVEEAASIDSMTLDKYEVSLFSAAMREAFEGDSGKIPGEVAFSESGRVAYYVYEGQLYRASALPEADMREIVTPEGFDDADFEYLSSSWNGEKLLFQTKFATVKAGETAGNINSLFLYANAAFANALPVVSNKTLETDEDAALDFCVADLGVADEDGDGVYCEVDASAASLGTVTKTQSGWRYIPDRDANGMDSVVLRAFDGTGWISQNIEITIKAVNDEPVWDASDTVYVPQVNPETVEVACGEAVSVQFSASDVDGDELVYGMCLNDQKAEMDWAVVDASSGAAGFAPHFETAPGVYSFEISCDDGHGGKISRSVQVTVSKKSYDIEAGIFLGSLSVQDDAGLASVGGEMALWLEDAEGCWTVGENIAGGWQALSVPGNAAAEELCQAFGVDSIVIFEGGRYVAVSEGKMNKGQGFWVNVDAAKMNHACILKIDLGASDENQVEGQSFFGPVLNGTETPAENAPVWKVTDGVFRRISVEESLKVGQGYWKE